MNHGRDRHTASLLTNGKVLVAGGSYYDVYLNTTELYDPFTETWTTANFMNITRHVHTSTLLKNGKVLVTGGWNMTMTFNSAELY